MSHFTNEKYEKYDRTEKKKIHKKGKKKKSLIKSFFSLRNIAAPG